MNHLIVNKKFFWLVIFLMLVLAVACSGESETPGGPEPTTVPTPGDVKDLSFTYEITWQLKENDPAFAIATVVMNADGGVEPYTYFRDDIEVAGPQFMYEWATCKANPGSLRVDSSDGQSVREDYFENPPCPTPTPTS